MIARNLLGIEDLDRSDIERILDAAEHMCEIGEREWLSSKASTASDVSIPSAN